MNLINRKEKNIDNFLTKAIWVFLIIFVIGSPFSISLAQMGLVPAIILWIIQIIYRRKKIKGSIIDFPILIYLTGELITSIFCEYSATAFAGYQGEWQILLLYVVSNTLNIDSAKKLLKILFIVSIVISIYGLYQHFTGWDIWRHKTLKPRYNFYDIVGGFGMHLTFGGYFMMIALVGWAYFNKINSKYRILYIIGTILITLATIGSYARSAWIGLLGGAVFLILITGKDKKRVIGSFLLILVIIGILLNVGAFRRRFFSMENILHSRRYQIWRVALLMIKDHPIIGVGNGNFKRYYPKYKMEPRKNFPEDKVMGHPHNDYLNIYITSGIIGLIGYLLMWFIILKKGLQYMKDKSSANKPLMAGLLSGIVAFMIAGLAQCYFTDSENSMLLWFYISIISLILLEEDKIKNKYFPIKM